MLLKFVIYKKNGDTYQTEYVSFKNIPPHQDKSLSAPDSSRGLTVEISIVSMNSSELELCYDTTLDPEAGDPDPFICK